MSASRDQHAAKGNRVTPDKSSAKRAKHSSGGGGEVLGVTVAWDFNSFVLHRTIAEDIFTRHGFEDVIDDKYATDGRARLRFAPGSGTVRKGSGIVVEEMERKKKDTPAALGIYIKRSKKGEAGDLFEPGARVRIDPTTGHAVVLPMDGLNEMGPRCREVAEQIAERCNLVRHSVVNNELSAALCAAGAHALWVPYRYSGGTYFIRDGDRCARFCALLEELETRGGTVEIDTFYGKRTRKRFEPSITELRADSEGRNESNVRRYAEASVEANMADIIRQLERWESGGNGRAATMEKKLEECDAVIERAEFYAPLLLEVAEKMVAKVEAVKARLGDLIKVETGPADADAVFAELDAKLAPPGELPDADLFSI